jgi:hypothetical protein
VSLRNRDEDLNQTENTTRIYKSLTMSAEEKTNETSQYCNAGKYIIQNS